MMSKTHFAFGLLVGLFFSSIFGIEDRLLFVSVCVLASLLPDIDYLFDFVFNSGIHRTLTHSIFFLAVAFIVCYFVYCRNTSADKKQVI